MPLCDTGKNFPFDVKLQIRSSFTPFAWYPLSDLQVTSARLLTILNERGSIMIRF